MQCGSRCSYFCLGNCISIASVINYGATIVIARKFSASHFWKVQVRMRVRVRARVRMRVRVRVKRRVRVWVRVCKRVRVKVRVKMIVRVRMRVREELDVMEF